MKLKNSDVIKAMRERLNKAIGEHKKNLVVIDESEKVITDAIGRLKDPGGLLSAVLEPELAGQKRNRVSCERAIADHEAALLYLKECRFDFDEAAAKKPGDNGIKIVTIGEFMAMFNTGAT